MFTENEFNLLNEVVDIHYRSRKNVLKEFKKNSKSCSNKELINSIIAKLDQMTDKEWQKISY